MCFQKKLQEVLNSIKELREKNNILKEKNYKLNFEVKLLSRKINFLEQKSISKRVEVIGISE